ncbi:Protein HEADING DATE 3B [Linum perenne]
MISPMFPRIQTSDTEKGPRAPPRNKMAAYNEQLSTIPSSSSSYRIGSSNMLPLPSGFCPSMVPSIPSIHRYVGSEKNIRMSTNDTSRHSHLAQRPYNSSSSAEPMAVLPTFANCNPFQPPWVPNMDLNITRGHHPRNQPDHDSVRMSIERSGSATSIRTSDSSPGPLCNLRKQRDQLCRGSRSDGVLIKDINVVARHDESSLAETSGSNSPACSTSVIITPDHVMNVMGEEQFWLARRAIMNQQRTFAAQVFELHRLVRVQRLIASSPDLPSSIETPSVKKLQHSNSPQQTNMKPPCLLQAGSQWLVPVMSPSEGLVYKPYFPPHGMVMPVENSSALHNRSRRYVTRSKEDSNCVPCQSSSSDMASTTSLVMIKVQSSDDDDDAVLNLFPLEPTGKSVETCDASKVDKRDNQEQRVIKVIPRNPRLATESAAKIFQLIQEERKRNYSQMLG